MKAFQTTLPLRRPARPLVARHRAPEIVHAVDDVLEAMDTVIRRAAALIPKDSKQADDSKSAAVH